MFASKDTGALEPRVLGDGAIEELRQSLRGELVVPDDPHRGAGVIRIAR